MEIYKIFVLGTVCGLTLSGLVYAIIIALKMKNKIKEQEVQIQDLSKKTEDIEISLNRRFDEFYERDYVKYQESLNREMDRKEDEVQKSLNEIRDAIGESLKYTDSRLDKVILKIDERFERVNNQIDLISIQSNIYIEETSKKISDINKIKKNKV